MNIKIPKISRQIYTDDVLNILENKYSIIGPIWTNHQMEWCNSIYSSFNDHNKFLIIIYLIKKTLNFYSRNFIKLSYNQFYLKNTVEIEKFNISELCKNINMPKETARRKILELKKAGIIIKNKKRTIIDRSVYPFISPENSVIKISRFLSIFSKILSEERVLSNSLSSEELKKKIELNFSYIWELYYEVQVPMLLGYKKVFGDIETFHIFGTCVVNQHLHCQKINPTIMSRKEFIKFIYSGNKMQGVNAMSISDITDIPRATVVRKLNKLVEKNYLSIDYKKHYRLTGSFAKKLVPLQSSVLAQLANFSTKVYNLVIL